MAFNSTRSGSFNNKEVLKYTSGQEILTSYVLDAITASTISADSLGRYIVPAGTPMAKTPTGKVFPYQGAPTTDIVGILSRPTELVSLTATSSYTPVALFSDYSVFATTQIVGFTTYASALISQLRSCAWK